MDFKKLFSKFSNGQALRSVSRGRGSAVEKVDPRSLLVTPPDVPPPEDVVRFVCISDTHNHGASGRCGAVGDVPWGDVLVHAGDFTMAGTMAEIVRFDNWIGSFPHPTKIVIAGNHERELDPGQRGAGQARRALRQCTYLQDQHTTVAGITVYGAPWTPAFHNMAFNLERGEAIREVWRAIPDHTDVVVTHGPPMGHGDLTVYGHRVGCQDLLEELQTRVRPKFHVFGHIHEGYGVTTDGTTTYVNASTCDVSYDACQAPVVFDVPVPPGHTKQPSTQH